MTDNEIIKALECCYADELKNYTCDECPYKTCGCSYALCRDALDFINRQQAEVERLQKGNDELGKAIAGAYELNCFLEATRKIVRVEAIKEFAERLKKPNRWREEDIYYIDTLVEEMVGEE